MFEPDTSGVATSFSRHDSRKLEADGVYAAKQHATIPSVVMIPGSLRRRDAGQGGARWPVLQSS